MTEQNETLNSVNGQTSDLTDGLGMHAMAFLEMAGRGCISGNVSEWPQLVPACKYAFDEINRLQRLISDSPLAVMDTRDVLGICAPTEDAFESLYALQGKKVRLVLDDVTPNAELRRPPETD